MSGDIFPFRLPVDYTNLQVLYDFTRYYFIYLVFLNFYVISRFFFLICRFPIWTLFFMGRRSGTIPRKFGCGFERIVHQRYDFTKNFLIFFHFVLISHDFFPSFLGDFRTIVEHLIMLLEKQEFIKNSMNTGW